MTKGKPILKSSALVLFRELIPNRLTRWLIASGFWTLLGLVSAIVWLALLIDQQPYTWAQLIRGKFIVWWLWGIITPAVLLIGARFSLLDAHKIPRTIILLVLSLVVTLGYMFGYAALVFLSQPKTIVGESYYRLANWILWTHWGYFYVGYWLTIAVEHVAEQMRRMHDASLAKEKLERELATARLDQVRSQMHPHFLFNTLNTISSQILTGDRHQAYDLVSGLANYLRQGLLAGESQFCTLKEEIELTEEYLSLILARYPDRLAVETSVAEDTLPLQVPSLLLQPLIENAVTHSVARFDSPTTLRISARREGSSLVIVLRNSTTAGRYQTTEPTHKRTHLGLHATTERLRLLYAQDAQLKVESGDSAFSATVTLPIRESDETVHLSETPQSTQTPHASITRSHR